MRSDDASADRQPSQLLPQLQLRPEAVHIDGVATFRRRPLLCDVARLITGSGLEHSPSTAWQSPRHMRHKAHKTVALNRLGRRVVPSEDWTPRRSRRSATATARRLVQARCAHLQFGHFSRVAASASSSRSLPISRVFGLPQRQLTQLCPEPTNGSPDHVALRRRQKLCQRRRQRRMRRRCNHLATIAKRGSGSCLGTSTSPVDCSSVASDRSATGCPSDRLASAEPWRSSEPASSQGRVEVQLQQLQPIAQRSVCQRLHQPLGRRS